MNLKTLIAVPLLAIPLTVSQAYPKLRASEMKCLTDNVYYEARGEPVKGQMLVARVTLNRAKSIGSICKVVYARKQFSWTKTKGLTPNDEEAYATAAKAAYAALWYHRPVYYYHNTSVNPRWAKGKKVIIKIGNHIFYGV